MKTFRIRYDIVHGGHKYPHGIIVTAAVMNDREAVRLIAESRLSGESPGYREEFAEILLREGFGFLPCGIRAITGAGWEEIPPILVYLGGGAVRMIANIPAGVRVSVIDRDSGAALARLRETAEPRPPEAA